MTLRMLDPTYDDKGEPFRLAPRVGGFKGLTVGVVSNGKKGTEPFFNAMERILIDEEGAASFHVFRKDNYSAPVPAHILAEAKSWDIAFTGIGD